MWYKAQPVQKYALNSQLHALQILTNDDEVENWSLSSFRLAVPNLEFGQTAPNNFGDGQEFLYFVMNDDFLLSLKTIKYKKKEIFLKYFSDSRSYFFLI